MQPHACFFETQSQQIQQGVGTVGVGLLSLHIISIRRVFCVLGGTNARLGTMPALPDRAAMGGGDTSHGLLPMKITRSIVQDRNPKVDNLCSPSLQVSDVHFVSVTAVTASARSDHAGCQLDKTEPGPNSRGQHTLR
jgi:hypothetical protein